MQSIRTNRLEYEGLQNDIDDLENQDELVDEVCKNI